MAFIPTPFTYRLVPTLTHPGGKAMVNVLHVRDTTPGPVSQALIDIVSAYVNWFAVSAADHVGDTFQLTRVVVTDVSVENGQQTAAQPGAAFGNVASPALPANVTFATAFKTGFSGRSFRGRGYWMGLCENQVTNNNLLTAQADGIRNAWTNLASILGDAGFAHGVVSYVSDGAPRAQGLFTQISQYVNTDTKVDTQRRRL